MMDKRIFYSIICFALFFILTYPQIQIVVRGTHTFYASDVIVIDEIPKVEYPHDLIYVYLGKSHFNLTVIFYNFQYNYTLVKQEFSEEYGKANITFSFYLLNITEDISGGKKVSELKMELWDKAKNSYPNTELVIAFCGEYAICPYVSGDKMVIGTAYVQVHVGMVYLGVDDEHKVYVGIHEVGHLLGLVHTSDYDDIMYPEYHGQEHFGETSIQKLIELHG